MGGDPDNYHDIIFTLFVRDSYHWRGTGCRYYRMDSNDSTCYAMGKIFGVEGFNMSEQFQAMLNKMSPEERAQFVEIMKDDNTYFADDLTDVVAILGQIQAEKKKL